MKSYIFDLDCESKLSPKVSCQRRTLNEPLEMHDAVVKVVTGRQVCVKSLHTPACSGNKSSRKVRTGLDVLAELDSVSEASSSH